MSFKSGLLKTSGLKEEFPNIYRFISHTEAWFEVRKLLIDACNRHIRAAAPEDVVALEQWLGSFSPSELLTYAEGGDQDDIDAIDAKAPIGTTGKPVSSIFRAIFGEIY